MSVNGMRSPTSTVHSLPVAAPGSDASANAKRAPGPGMDGARPTELLERLPQRTGEATITPRVALAKLVSVRPEQAVSTLSEAGQAIAAKVSGGRIALLGSHSPATVKAAAGVAAMGLLALKKDLFIRG